MFKFKKTHKNLDFIISFKGNFVDYGKSLPGLNGNIEVRYRKPNPKKKEKAIALIGAFTAITAALEEENIVKNQEELKELIDKMEHIHNIDI